MKTNDPLEPTVFVIFGGGGDLTWRKLVPALFDLSQVRSLPANYSIIAVDRLAMSDEALRTRLHAGVNQFSRFGKARTFQRFAIGSGDRPKRKTVSHFWRRCARRN
jgi:glucose-6-phosphate 1-dehydrogenase